MSTPQFLLIISLLVSIEANTYGGEVRKALLHLLALILLIAAFINWVMP